MTHATNNVPPAYSYGSYEHNPKIEDELREALEHGMPLLLFGSSELSLNKLPSIPYNFFNKTLNIPCIGMGHAGNQCFCICSQLCAMSNALKNGRIIVILSPGWFSAYAKGTSLESFLEFNDERLLYNIYFNKNLPKIYKDYESQYIYENEASIESASAILKAFYYYNQANKNIVNKIVFTPFEKLYENYCLFKISVTNKLLQKGDYEAPLMAYDSANVSKTNFSYTKTVNWDSMYATARKDFDTVSTNNNMDISNDYYARYVKTHHSFHIQPVPLSQNVELQDFTMLLKLLKQYNTDAYFIIQPINPLAYDDVKELKPTIDVVCKKMDSLGFNYLNLYVTDSISYQKGTLNDIMHMGNLGWYRTDSAILCHFNSTGHE